MRLQLWERWLLALIALLVLVGVGAEACEWGHALHGRVQLAILRLTQP